MNDLELKLLAGDPIDIGVGKLHPLKLKQVKEIGETTYTMLLSLVNIQLEGDQKTDYQFFIDCSREDENFKNQYLTALSYFFNEQVHVDERGFFYLGEVEDGRWINEEIFESIRSVINKQNFIKDKSDEEEYNPADDEAQKLVDQLKAFKSKIKQQNQEKGLDLEDIIGIVATCSPNYNFFSVFDLTVYQLYTVYIRLMMKETYRDQFAVYLQLGDPDKVELNHWARKLDT